jgi:putative DNA primase/helicase
MSLQHGTAADKTVRLLLTRSVEEGLADGAACLAAALDYLRMGLAVDSCCPPCHVGIARANPKHADRCSCPGKVPWHVWEHLQTDLPDERTVRDWWRRLPNANVGVALGGKPDSPPERVRLVRIDGDGDKAVRELERLTAGDPPTPTFCSGRTDGGLGVLYEMPPDVDWRTAIEGDALGELRVMCTGSQTILPPSRHVSGRYYRWRAGLSPAEVQLQPAPTWLAKRMAERGGKGRSPERNSTAAPIGEEILDGSRDTTLTSLAGSMRRRGMSEGAIHAALAVVNAEQCRPPLDDVQVRKIARSIGRYPPDPGASTPVAAAATNDPSPITAAVGQLLLVAERPRLMPSGKISLSVAVRRDGVRVDTVSVSSSPASRSATARVLAAHLTGQDAPDRSAVDRALTVLLTGAAEAVERATASPSGPTLAEIVAEIVRPALDLRYRTQRGTVWSEAQGRELSRSDVIAYTPDSLVRQAAQAADAPTGRAALLRAVTAELAVLWASLVPSLPLAAAAAATATATAAAAAKAFRSAMVLLWTRPVTFEIDRAATGGGTVASRASLVSRVRSKFGQPETPDQSKRWQQIQAAHSAWWRRSVTPGDGEHVILLSLRWELCHQIGVELPGVTCQNDLTTLGERYGVLDRQPPAATRLSGGSRLAVLSQDLTGELLEDVATLEDDAGVQGDAAEPVTQ